MTDPSPSKPADKRFLCYNFKINKRSTNVFFFRKILGMKVVRHEEVEESCSAEECTSNANKNWYQNRWSRTWFAYGRISKYFVIELIYAYGAKKLEKGNDFDHITIKAADVLDRVAIYNYPIKTDNGINVLLSPDGYKFHIINEARVKGIPPLMGITLNSNDLKACKKYWNEFLKMNILEQDSKSIQFSYGTHQVWMRKLQIDEPIDRSKKFGRLSFGVLPDVQKAIETAARAAQHTVGESVAFADFPDVKMVKVIILTDPDGQEVTFAEEEPDSLWENDPELDLEIFIAKDPFDEKQFLTH